MNVIIQTIIALGVSALCVFIMYQILCAVFTENSEITKHKRKLKEKKK